MLGKKIFDLDSSTSGTRGESDSVNSRRGSFRSSNLGSPKYDQSASTL